MALSAIATAVFTVCLVIIALIAWWTAKKTLDAARKSAEQAEETVRQMRKDSIGMQEDSARASRPYLFAQLVPGLAGEGCWDLLITNAGRSGAFNMTMEIESPTENDDKVTRGARRLAESGMAIPPGGRVRTYWYVQPDERSRDEPEGMGYPSARISLTYSDADGKVFSDPGVELGPNFLGLTPSPTTGPTATGMRDDKSMRNVAHALRAIAHHLGEIHR